MALLRASGEHDGRDYDLAQAIETGTSVPHGPALVALVEATLRADDATLNAARARVVADLGLNALHDAAAVMGGFDGITRIADAIGIPLEPAKAEMTADFFAALDLGRFRAAKT